MSESELDLTGMREYSKLIGRGDDSADISRSELADLLDRLEAADARWARVEAELADAEAREDNMVPKWFRLAVDPK